MGGISSKYKGRKSAIHGGGHGMRYRRKILRLYRAAFEPIIYLPLRAFQNAQQLIKVHAAFYNGVLVFLFHN